MLSTNYDVFVAYSFARTLHACFILCFSYCCPLRPFGASSYRNLCLIASFLVRLELHANVLHVINRPTTFIKVTWQ